MKAFQSKTLRFGALAIVLAGLGYWGKQYFAPANPAPDYTTAIVTRADIENTVLATGTVEALKQVSVGAQVSGQLKSLKVALGEQVKAGQLIAEIDSVTQQNTLKNAEASLANTRAQLMSKEASMLLAQRAFRRQQVLLSEDATAVSDHESAEASLKMAQADVAALKASVQEGEIAVETAKANLGYTRILAPMDGIVVAVVTKEGQTVNANQSAPTIIKLAKLDQVTIKAEISEADVIHVKSGQKVYFTILGQPDKRYYSVIREIEPAPTSISSDSATSSTSSTSSAVYYNALLEVPNPGHQFRIDMTAQVYVVLADARKVLTVPASALGQRQPDGSYLVKVMGREKEVSSRRIRIGINNRVSVEVVSGLKEGEQIILGDASLTTSSSTRRGGRLPMGL
ncbi:efflux RND transporter periplasmic adaptor subunit [Leeia oryzae]|uniref:efflux RND transporter periplasmic adaptor subunit n=1 Tax=Leeia oryzae TaxID=356662 RepID=UPI0003665CC2|nr:efflux RND transporter periplasmic adaptor subunit [Leeia oryzae]